MPRRQLQSSSPVPADVLLTLAELEIPVEKISDDEAWSLCPGPHAKRVGKPDQHASWSINLNDGDHHCFSCGWGGPFILLVKWVYNWTKPDDDEKARAWIRKHGGISVARRKLRGEVGYVKEKAEDVSEADLLLFADPPQWALEDKDVDLESCYVYDVRWDPEKDQWIFPIREPYTDKLLGWQGKGKDTFLNHPKNIEKAKTLFGFQHLMRTKSKTAYLYESPVDAVRLHTFGIDGAVSSYGVHVSDYQMQLLADEVDTLYVCLDNDGAGRRKEREIWEEHRKQFRQMLFVNYDQVSRRTKDHGEMTMEEIEWSLNNAISAVRFRP